MILSKVKIYLKHMRVSSGVLGYPPVSWGILRCPGVIRPTLDGTNGAEYEYHNYFFVANFHFITPEMWHKHNLNDNLTSSKTEFSFELPFFASIIKHFQNFLLLHVYITYLFCSWVQAVSIRSSSVFTGICHNTHLLGWLCTWLFINTLQLDHGNIANSGCLWWRLQWGRRIITRGHHLGKIVPTWRQFCGSW